MASKRVRVDHLRNVPLFRDCTRKELEQIAMRRAELDVRCDRAERHFRACQLLRSSTWQRMPGARESLASAVRSG